MAIGSKRNVKVEIQASSRQMDRGLRDAKGKLEAFKKETGRGMARITDAGRSAGGSLMRMGAAALGGMALTDLATAAVGFERSMTRLQIATDSTDSQMALFRKSIIDVSRESGISSQEIIGSASAYVALTGDAAGARESIALFAKVANATGSTMDDIANTAAAMRDNLKIDPKDFEPAFSALAVQGKAGAVELRELASQLAGIAPSFAAFKGGSGVDGLREMGAALQVIRKGFGTAAEGSTGFRALMAGLQRHSGKFGKAGVRIFNIDRKTGKQTLRDFSDIIDDIGKSKLAMKPKLLIDAFGSDEAKRAYDQLVLNRGLFDELIAKSKDSNAINRDAAKFQLSAAGKLDKAWNEMRLALAEAFTPDRVLRFAASLEKAAAGAAKLVALIEHIESFIDLGDNTAKQMDVIADLRKKGFSMDEAITRSQQMRDTIGLPQAPPPLRTPLEERAVMSARGTQNTPRGVIVQAIAEGFRRANEIPWHTRPPYNSQAVNVAVKVGTDTLAVGSANAPAHRTRPGGL